MNLFHDYVRYETRRQFLSRGANAGIFIGARGGVYATDNVRGSNTSWVRFGTGLPMVSVTDMFISRTGAMMRVATYGRGLWEIYPSATAEKGVNGDGDWDRNQQLDFVDLAASASRLGTDPATTALPYYDWNTDITGTVNGTDSADLTELLNRLGGRP